MRVRDSESLCENGSLFAASADFSNISVRQAPIPVIGSVVMPSLLCRIGVVLRSSANSQMSGVNARRVITSVHDDLIIRDRPDVKLVRVTMSANRLFARQQKDPVSILITVAFPFPATIAFIKARLKNIMRAKQCVVAKASLVSRFCVALAAQLSAHNLKISAFNATESIARLVCHWTPPLRRFYAITEV